MLAEPLDAVELGPVARARQERLRPQRDDAITTIIASRIIAIPIVRLRVAAQHVAAWVLRASPGAGKGSRPVAAEHGDEAEDRVVRRRLALG